MGQRLLGGEVLDEAGAASRPAPPTAAARRGRSADRHSALDLVDVDRLEQRLPVGEVAIQRPDPHLRAPRDLLERRRGPPFRECIARGRDHLVVVAPRVRTLGARRSELINGVGGAHRGRSRAIRLTTGGGLRIVPEGASTSSGGGLHFSTARVSRQPVGIHDMNTASSPAPTTDRRRWMGPCGRLPRAADDRARHHDRERRASRRSSATSTSPRATSPGWSTPSSSRSEASCCSPAGSGTCSGRRRVFLPACVVFTAASALCGSGAQLRAR